MWGSSDMVFITAGILCAPVIAEIARDLGALTVAVVTDHFILKARVEIN